MDETDRLPVLLGDEHVLSSREVTDVVGASLHMGVEDALCVCAVVAVIEWTERPNHEVGDPLEVISRRRADGDVVDDR